MNQNSNGIPLPYAQAKQQGLIDSRIAPLIDVMNEQGSMTTIGCCEGHGTWLSSDATPPYVYFSCTVDVARRFNQQLVADAASPVPKLHYAWFLSAMFNMEDELCFLLKTDINFRWQQRYRRKALDADFAVLSTLMKDKD